MSHLCQQLVQASLYLQLQGMSQEHYSQLHHFSLKGREVTFTSTLRYFGTSKNLRQNNIAFAERCKYVESEHRRTGESFAVLIEQALQRFPL